MVIKFCYGCYVMDVIIFEVKLNILKSFKNLNIIFKDNLFFIILICCIYM